ncbi:reticulophagy regulator 3-like isoform X2 [Conger conger]|uniref:reticulophagy regulator 3-like isoform X2 n=1 Tax=Conger conger TaxID=82655 RepID=UPI002A5ACACB|nr:reticulophagy regulator 3-like isoform X2 [Conger conger]
MAIKKGEGTEKLGLGVGLRSRPSSNERDGQVRAVKASLLVRLGPYEPLLTYLQSVLVWERPLHSVLLYTVINAVFWSFVLTSLRLLSLLSAALACVVCADTWRNRIWPKIRVKRASDTENDSWGLVHPGILSVPELCHHMAEAWVSALTLTASCVKFKRQNPGKFCVLVCSFFTLLAMVGHYIPGLVLCYSAVLGALLFPLAVQRGAWPRLCVLLEPALRRLDFSTGGYMMAQPKQNQFLCRAVRHMTPDEASDSEEELASFCPTLDDAVVARELAITDSEHSDAEASYTDNGTFNWSRGQTPLTESLEGRAGVPPSKTLHRATPCLTWTGTATRRSPSPATSSTSRPSTPTPRPWRTTRTPASGSPAWGRRARRGPAGPPCRTWRTRWTRTRRTSWTRSCASAA